MKKIFFLLLIFYFILPLGANTTRDIGDEINLDLKLVAKWILFYTNTERIRNNLSPVQYDPDLEKAAVWQAEYNSKMRTLEHIISAKDMKTPKDRIEYFGGRCGNCGENLTVKFAVNSEGIPFAIKKDSNGTYYNYGTSIVKWRNEQEMGYTMVDSWMKSPGHRKNILGNGFKWIGAGIAKGIYSNNKSYYGCQVFNGFGGLPESFIKAKYQLSGFQMQKNIIDDKEVYIFIYNGELIPGVIEVNKDKELKSYDFVKKDKKYIFVKNMSVAADLFAALYDKKNNIFYPVILLK
ncbi:MAG: CAP domain-containing protein [Spirochaetes bacterium]|nr:CAP domain-containing protein [Spirochaetota bacterium]